jgi:hypothetical protein
MQTLYHVNSRDRLQRTILTSLYSEVDAWLTIVSSSVVNRGSRRVQLQPTAGYHPEAVAIVSDSSICGYHRVEFGKAEVSW